MPVVDIFKAVPVKLAVLFVRFTKVPAVEADEVTLSNPPVEVYAPLWLICTKPFAIAEVPEADTFKAAPLVIPEPAAMFVIVPVVMPVPDTFCTTPPVVALPVTLSRPPLPVYAPLAVSCTIPFVTAPVVAEVTFKAEPDVRPVAEEVIERLSVVVVAPQSNVWVVVPMFMAPLPLGSPIASNAVAAPAQPVQEVTVKAPPLVSFATLVFATWKSKKLPVKLAGLAPMYVPLVEPLERAVFERLNNACVAEAFIAVLIERGSTGVPVPMPSPVEFQIPVVELLTLKVMLPPLDPETPALNRRLLAPLSPLFPTETVAAGWYQ